MASVSIDFLACRRLSCFKILFSPHSSDLSKKIFMPETEYNLPPGEKGWEERRLRPKQRAPGAWNRANFMQGKQAERYNFQKHQPGGKKTVRV
jgi:hypothetical protein